MQSYFHLFTFAFMFFKYFFICYFHCYQFFCCLFFLFSFRYINFCLFIWHYLLLLSFCPIVTLFFYHVSIITFFCFIFHNKCFSYVVMSTFVLVQLLSLKTSFFPLSPYFFLYIRILFYLYFSIFTGGGCCQKLYRITYLF